MYVTVATARAMHRCAFDALARISGKTFFIHPGVKGGGREGWVRGPPPHHPHHPTTPPHRNPGEEAMLPLVAPCHHCLHLHHCHHCHHCNHQHNCKVKVRNRWSTSRSMKTCNEKTSVEVSAANTKSRCI